MKLRSHFATVLAAGAALGFCLSATAAVSDEDFNAFKDLVNKRLDQLEKVHEQDQKTILEDQKKHEQDQQEIQRLREQMQQTQKTAADAQQKAEAAAQVQPVAAVAQGPDATHNFMMVGDAEIQFGKIDGSHSAFGLADFAPIFLFRARDKILFEAGFDMNLSNGGSPPDHDAGTTTSIGISFAQLDYLLNDYVTFVGGYMLLPLGTYSERAAGFLNKIITDPMSRDILPGAGAGIQFRGAIPVGTRGQHLTYAVYGANGPGSADGTGSHDQLDLGGNIGFRNDGSFGNLHSSPSGGGRIGWFYPFKAHYDFELGISGQTGTWDDMDRRLWSAAIVDAAVHIGPSIELKGEYMRSFVQTDDIGTFDQRGGWLQVGYKLAGLNLDLPLINNLELVGRYDNFNDGLGTHADRYTLGYVYYFSNTLLFKGDYGFRSSNDDSLNHNELLFQVSYGF